MKYCLAILLALASFNSWAGLTKWVDSAGRVHYSDGPPPANVRSQRLHMRSTYSQGGNTTKAASAPGAPKTIFEQEADLNKERKARQAAEKKQAQKEKQAKIKRQNCMQARSRLNTLRNAPRIASYDAQGNPTIMSDAARSQETQRAEAAVNQYCN